MIVWVETFSSSDPRLKGEKIILEDDKNLIYYIFEDNKYIRNRSYNITKIVKNKSLQGFNIKGEHIYFRGYTNIYKLYESILFLFGNSHFASFIKDLNGDQNINIIKNMIDVK